MADQEGTISMETFAALAQAAGLELDEKQLTKLKPGFNFVKAEVERLREWKLDVVEPAMSFQPDLNAGVKRP